MGSCRSWEQRKQEAAEAEKWRKQAEDDATQREQEAAEVEKRRKKAPSEVREDLHKCARILLLCLCRARLPHSIRAVILFRCAPLGSGAHSEVV